MANDDQNTPGKSKGFSDIKDDKTPAPKSSKSDAEKSKSSPLVIGGLVAACWVALLVTGSVSTVTVLGMAVVTAACGWTIYKNLNS